MHLGAPLALAGRHAVDLLAHGRGKGGGASRPCTSKALESLQSLQEEGLLFRAVVLRQWRTESVVVTSSVRRKAASLVGSGTWRHGRRARGCLHRTSAQHGILRCPCENDAAALRHATLKCLHTQAQQLLIAGRNALRGC